jgi:hypothetical protein
MKGLQVTKKVRSNEKGTKLRNRYEATKKGTKLRKRYEVTNMARSYEKGTKMLPNKLRKTLVQRCDVMLTVTSSMNAVLHKAYK